MRTTSSTTKSAKPTQERIKTIKQNKNKNSSLQPNFELQYLRNLVPWKQC